MTKEPFDIDKWINHKFGFETVPNSQIIAAFIELYHVGFSKGREQGLDLAASGVACATKGTEWSDLVDDILSLKAEGGTELKAESSKEVSGKEGE